MQDIENFEAQAAVLSGFKKPDSLFSYFMMALEPECKFNVNATYTNNFDGISFSMIKDMLIGIWGQLESTEDKHQKWANYTKQGGHTVHMFSAINWHLLKKWDALLLSTKEVRIETFLANLRPQKFRQKVLLHCPAAPAPAPAPAPPLWLPYRLAEASYPVYDVVPTMFLTILLNLCTTCLLHLHHLDLHLLHKQSQLLTLDVKFVKGLDTQQDIALVLIHLIT